MRLMFQIYSAMIAFEYAYYFEFGQDFSWHCELQRAMMNFGGYSTKNLKGLIKRGFSYLMTSSRILKFYSSICLHFFPSDQLVPDYDDDNYCSVYRRSYRSISSL